MATLAEWRGWLVTSGAFLGVVAVTVAATLPIGRRGGRHLPLRGSGYRRAPRCGWPSWATRWPGGSGFALQADQPQQTYNVDIDNGAIVACGVLRSTEYRAHGVPDPMATQLQSGRPASSQWPALWPGNVDQFRPNVVMVLAGRWEVMDRLVDGTLVPHRRAALRRGCQGGRSSRRCRWPRRAGPTWCS